MAVFARVVYSLPFRRRTFFRILELPLFLSYPESGVRSTYYDGYCEESLFHSYRAIVALR